MIDPDDLPTDLYYDTSYICCECHCLLEAKNKPIIHLAHSVNPECSRYGRKYLMPTRQLIREP